MPSLSVVLATFNEEENIAECLTAVKDIADEIIIVDGSSTDKTVEIAKKFNAKVLVTENHPIFHINKQKAIDMATKDWILQLDADERVTPELAREIKRVIEFSDDSMEDYQKNLTERDLFLRHQQLVEERDGKIGDRNAAFTAFFVPRLNYFLGKPLRYGGVYPDGVIRLLKKGKAYLPAKDVHEQMVVKGAVGWLQYPLLHKDSPTFARYMKRNNRYTDLMADQYAKDQLGKDLKTAIEYVIFKPLFWFLLTQVRHKGILDGYQGVIFSFFSALRFPIAYTKYLVKDIRYYMKGKIEPPRTEPTTLEKVLAFFILYKYRILVSLIILTAFVVRFYHLDTRINLNSDNSRDIAIVQEALQRHELPSVEQLSYAGSFMAGPLYYWLLMGGYWLFPQVFAIPWIVFGLIGIAAVGFLIYCGKKIGGEFFSIVVGLLAAVSPPLVVHSLELGQQNFNTTVFGFILLLPIFFFGNKRLVKLFFVAIALAAAVMFFYKAVTILIFLPLLLLVITYVLFSLFQGNLLSKRYLFVGKIVAVTVFFIMINNSITTLRLQLSQLGNIISFQSAVDTLESAFPGKQFALYDYNFAMPDQSLPISVLLLARNLSNPNGLPIGVVCAERCLVHNRRIAVYRNVFLVDLQGEDFRKNTIWVRVDSDDIYNNLIKRQE